MLLNHCRLNDITHATSFKTGSKNTLLDSHAELVFRFEAYKVGCFHYTTYDL